MAAKGNDHSFRATLGNSYVGSDGVVLVQNVRSVADWNSGILTGIGEDRLPGNSARSRGLEADEGCVIQRQNVILSRLGQE